MKRKEKHPNISVRTIPNGYSLSFDGMQMRGGFMYFTPEELLEGFMLHIGLKMTEQLNPQTMKDFIAAAMACKDTKAMMHEAEKAKDEIARLNSKYHALVVRMITDRRRLVSLIEDVRSANGHSSMTQVKKILAAAIKSNKSIRLLTLKDFGYKSEDIIEDETDE